MTAKKKGVTRSIVFRPDVEKELQAYMKAKNLRNVSATVNDLLDFALRPERRDERNSDMAQLYHQLLYSLNAHRKKTARDLAANQEILLQFILDYYKSNPAATDAMDEGRSDIAVKRLDKLMENVVQNLGKSKLLPENVEGENGGE
ncbi:MAG: hypothetical protein ACRBB3_10110 [Alphaproteobacteria bacterium]